MSYEQRIEAITRLLCQRGWDSETALKVAKDAVEDGEAILETLCFWVLAEHVLATIHTVSWVTARAENSDNTDYDVIRRLLKSGAQAEDLAIFARMMQREYLCNLGCILDGASILGTPRLPCEDFRVFSVDESDKPLVAIGTLHGALEWDNLEREMQLSRNAEDASTEFFKKRGWVS
jgi:hypothetical protein